MNHDSKFVWLAQENIASFVKTQYPKMKKINYVRYVSIMMLLGSYSFVSFNLVMVQPVIFKNNYTILNLLYRKKDFGLEACWTFSATGHDIDPCDGIGAIVKATGTRATPQGHTNTNFQSALDFWSFIFDRNDQSQLNEASPVDCCFLPKEQVERIYRDTLERRWNQITFSSKCFRIVAPGIDSSFSFRQVTRD